MTKIHKSIIFRRFVKSKSGMIGLVLVLGILSIAVFAENISPYSYVRMVGEPVQPPSSKFLFGTDELGRDTFSRILFGARVSVIVALFSQIISVLVGASIGAIAGFFGGKIDDIIMRVVDIFMGFPFFLLAIVTVAVLGPSFRNVIISLAVVMWPGMARLVRGQALSIREQEYIAAATVIGKSKGYIILRHVMPNCFAPVIIQVSIDMAHAILGEAGLSFLGLGIQPPTPSWGQMLGIGKDYLSISPYMCIFPGIFIMIIVLGFNLLGDGLRDTLDPRLKM